MSDVIHTYDIEHDGYSFRVEHVADNDHGAPWLNEDGHGVISDWTTRDKSPGELVLNSDRSSKRFYDFAETCRIALRDDWGTYWFNGYTAGMTRREFAAQKAREDYERMRAWCNDEWYYVGVVVTLLDIEGNETDAVQSLWGIESDAGDYLSETTCELAGNVLHDISAMLYGDDGAIYMSGSRSWRVKE